MAGTHNPLLPEMATVIETVQETHNTKDRTQAITFFQKPCCIGIPPRFVLHFLSDPRQIGC